MGKINRVAEGLIRTLIDAGKTYQEEILETIAKYKKDLAQINATADKRYQVRKIVSNDISTMQNAERQEQEERKVMERYKADYVAEKKSALAEKARESIRSAQDSFQATAHQTEKVLREELEKSMLQPINAGFLRLAQTLYDFSVSPSRLEIDALLVLSEGNLTATRVIDSLLKKTESRFSLSYRKPEEYSNDIALIHDLGTDDYFCSPLSDHHEMTEIFSGELVGRDEESSLYKRGLRFNSTELIVRGQTFETAMERLENMVGQWASDIHYESSDILSEQLENEEKTLAEIEDRTPSLPEYRSTITVNEVNPVIDVARQIGHEKSMMNKSVLNDLDFKKDFIKA